MKLHQNPFPVVKILRESLPVLSFLSIFVFAPFQHSFAADYLRLYIEPQNVGTFYNLGEQQFTCFGETSSGDWVDITDEVDWYVEADPLSGQTKPPTDTVSIDETGLATILDTWGRVKISACFPKGCSTGGSNNGGSINTIPAVSLLIKPSYDFDFNITGDGVVEDVAGMGLDCASIGSESCTALYRQGREVTLEATPDRGFENGVWSGDCGTTDNSTDCSVTMDSAKTAGATFVALTSYNLELTVPVGGVVRATAPGVLNPLDLNCDSGSSPCNITTYDTEVVTLSVDSLTAGYTYGSWTGGGCSGTTETDCVVNVSAANAVSVTFTALDPFDLDVTVAPDMSHGNVTSNPTGIDCGNGTSV